MPGYGKRMEMYAPEPTEDVKELDQRFKVPTVTPIQMVIVAMIAVYAWTARKMNKALVSTVIVALTLFHTYDHLFRVTRGAERSLSFSGASKEGYCGACQK